MFYVIMNGILSEIQLSYLAHPTGKRLEKTLTSHSHRQDPEVLSSQKTYAIEVMSKSVITESDEISVEKALKIFKENHIHHLILNNKKARVVGLVSDRDLLWVEKIHVAEHAMAKQFMAKTILCCHENTPIDHIARVMVQENISALPVLSDEHKLAGIVTHHDLLKWFY